MNRSAHRTASTVSRRVAGLFVVGLALLSVAQQAAFGQSAFDELLGTATAVGPTDDQVAVSAEFTAPKDGKPGQLSIVCKIQPGWHIYSLTQPDGGPLRSEIALDKSPQYKVGAWTSKPAPHEGTDPAFEGVAIESHENEVIWSASVELAAGADPSKLEIKGTVTVQACNATGCIPPTDYKFAAKLASDVYRAEGKHTALSGYVEPTGAAVGKSFKLVITATPDADYHVYAWADKQPDTGVQPTLISLAGLDGWKIGTPVASSKPNGESEGVPYHSQAVSWTIDLTPPANLKPGGASIAGRVTYQSCSERTCDQPASADFAAKIEVGAAKPGKAPLKFSAASKSKGFDTSQIRAPVSESESMAGMLGLAFLGGVLLNFMPCVLPVIGLKLFSFMQQAGESRWRVLSLNLWYTAGLMSVFLVLAWLAISLGYGWGALNTMPAYIISMTAIVFAMALSFLGVWEIPIPGFAAGSSAQKLSDREGPAGAFSKGIVTTLLATPCTGPLMAGALAWAAGQPPAVVLAVFTSLGLGMASPYLVIGAFPALIRWLPKPGVWMETFKQLMGFVLLGTVVWLMMSIQAEMLVPTVGLLFGLWMALWWFGRTPLYAEFGERVRAWAGAIAIGVLAYTIPFNLLLGTSEHELDWQPFAMSKLEQLAAENKTVIVDFTADWCPTCKVLEHVVLNTEGTKEFVEANGIVALKADITHIQPSDNSAEYRLLSAVANTVQIPVLAIFPAGRPLEPIVFKEPYTQKQLLEELKKAGPSQGGQPEVRQARVD